MKIASRKIFTSYEEMNNALSGMFQQYHPDLASSDYHLLPKMKKEFLGNVFTRYEEVKNTVSAYFLGMFEHFFRQAYTN